MGVGAVSNHVGGGFMGRAKAYFIAFLLAALVLAVIGRKVHDLLMPVLPGLMLIAVLILIIRFAILGGRRKW
jgi:hypothetical protein